VLHVHGYNDYVFQAHVAAALADRGYAFYGVDLRRCGRSRRQGEVAHFTTDMAEYRSDLDAAVAVVRAAGHPWVAVQGHSTGGLAAALWAAARPAGTTPAGPDALVLDSPWLSLNGGWWRRASQAAVAGVVGRLAPLRPVERGGGGSAYQRQLHVANGGRWEYDLALKPPGGFPVRAGWLRAAVRGQRAVARGLALDVPVLVCTSASYGPNRDDNPDLGRQETVLDLAQTWRLAPRLGPDLTLVRIEGGVHDLSLSADRPREEYLGTVLDWLDAHVGRPA
jgi:alpha-beta hydrolase superfamily lysophospholipase